MNLIHKSLEISIRWYRRASRFQEAQREPKKTNEFEFKFVKLQEKPANFYLELLRVKKTNAFE